MSRFAALVAILLAAPAWAQDSYGPPDPAKAAPVFKDDKCPPQRPNGEIVVCAELEDQDQFRVKSSGELDPEGAGAKGGVPRAPDVGTTYPGVVVATGCFIPPCPPPMPKIIDLKAIPEAPPGSDADRAAKGLAPARGGKREDADGDAAPAAVAATPPE